MPSPLAASLVKVCSDYLDGHCSDGDLRRHLNDLSANQLKELVRALDRSLHEHQLVSDSDGGRAEVDDSHQEFSDVGSSS